MVFSPSLGGGGTASLKVYYPQVCHPGRIDGPYALDVRRKWTLSNQMLSYCSPICYSDCGRRVTAVSRMVTNNRSPSLYCGQNKVI